MRNSQHRRHRMCGVRVFFLRLTIKPSTTLLRIISFVYSLDAVRHHNKKIINSKKLISENESVCSFINLSC